MAEHAPLRTSRSDYERMEQLLTMACNDKCPNAEFSDFECNVWEMFKRVLRKEGLSND